MSENVFVVIIDGVRYSETFGDDSFNNISKMRYIAQEGCVSENFYNDGRTKTLNGINAIVTGDWPNFWLQIIGKKLGFKRRDALFSKKPTIWEYYRKQLKAPKESAYYSFPYNTEGGFQPVSHHKEYGEDYWPIRGDLYNVIEQYHPKLAVIYLGETDGAGHSGDRAKYIQAIRNADEIVGELWRKIQSDPIYRDKTTLMVTNDHGRHDDKHGGFKDHGCGCDGCRHIMFLAIGPDFRKNYKLKERYTLIDISPTIGKLLGFNPEYSTGRPIDELFNNPPKN